MKQKMYFLRYDIGMVAPTGLVFPPFFLSLCTTTPQLFPICFHHCCYFAYKLGTMLQRDKRSTNSDLGLKVGTAMHLSLWKYDLFVINNDTPFWIQIYAPWCGHCQSLEPTYNKLAKHLSGVDSLVIAKMDGTTNEHPRAKVCITAVDGWFWLTIHFFWKIFFFFFIFIIFKTYLRCYFDNYVFVTYVTRIYNGCMIYKKM